MRRVGALLIGAQKAGTTSLCRYVEQHPNIEFSYVKEITFFIDAALYADGVDYYHQFFPNVGDDVLLMSSHVHMLAHEDAPSRVLQYNPDMKFIVLLREPVARAWSAYNYAKSNRWESDDASFESTLALETARMASDDHRQQYDLAYFNNGLYWHHLSRWLQYFDRERFLLLRSSDLREVPGECLRKVWRFLGVDPAAQIDVTREYNTARSTRWQWLTTLLYDKESRIKSVLRAILPGKTRIWVRRWLIPILWRANTRDSAVPEVPAEARRALAEYYQDDLQKLDREFGIRF